MSLACGAVGVNPVAAGRVPHVSREVEFTQTALPGAPSRGATVHGVAGRVRFGEDGEALKDHGGGQGAVPAAGDLSH